MVGDGADAIDIGGESTRPGAEDVPWEEQARRVLPVIEGVRRRSDVPISIDTRDPRVGERALEAGADIVNDVSAPSDPAWIDVLASRPRVPVVLMHTRGNPRTMRTMTDYPGGVVAEIRRSLDERIRDLEARGIDRRRVIVDPGIGFAKSAEQNLEILARLDELAALGPPLLFGASRKLFLGRLLSARRGDGSARADDPRERDIATVVANAIAVLGGASILRVHNVALNRDLADVVEGLRSAVRSSRGSGAG
jgi:dihydropteroate synthase